jgi:acyl-CoA thioester hydrolase
MISAEVVIEAQFYDLDPMQVVWHGNYARYLEIARCALLNRIGYNYPEMQSSGYVWPVVDMRIKYVRPIRFGDSIIVTASLAEYENRLKIDYRIRDQAGQVVTKAHTIQVAVRADGGEMLLESPPILFEKIKAVL